MNEEGTETNPDGTSGAAASLFERLIGGMNAVGSVWILALMALINSDILGRELLDSPVRGVSEMVSLSIVAIVFLQLPHTLWVGRITRNDAVARQLARRAPRFGASLEALFASAGAALFAMLAATSWPYFTTAIRVYEYKGSYGDFMFPTWPVRLIIVVGSIAMCVAFALRAIESVRRSFGASS